MVNKDIRKCIISVGRKRTTPMGTSFYERYVTVEGENLSDAKKIFDEINKQIDEIEQAESKGVKKL